MRNQCYLLAFGCIFFLSSFITDPGDGKQPKTITKLTTLVDGMKIEKTIIVLDGRTSREELIHTCSFLAKENVQLTFDQLTIGKSFLGLAGRQRIRKAEGTIMLANGVSHRFKAGGLNSFKSIKIQYANNAAKSSSQMEMIEITD